MKREILLRGECRSNADIFYFAGVPIHDPFYAFTLRGKKCALIGALELGRLRQGGLLDEVFDISALAEKWGASPADDTAILSRLFKKNGVRALAVPADFPALCLERLRAEGFDVEVRADPIFPERNIKCARELREISKANAVASLGFARVAEILRRSEIRAGKLFFEGSVLTSQFLRFEIEKTALENGADALYTIAAAGAQACNPHEAGRGAVEPNSLIVVDIFPRLRESGYYGDMTRTFLKGEPSSAQERLVKTVLKAQKLALSKVKAGADGSAIHKSVERFFEKSGYFTEFKRGAWNGFFHSTGHGVGLDIHEKISLGRRKCILRPGNVVTVEPGLYYRGIGGCRIEDTVAVCENGAKKLSSFPYDWVVK